MRFVLMVKGSAASEAGAKASPALVEAMGRYNDEMVRAGIVQDGVGLRPSSDGVRIVYEKGKQTRVLDGPFAETKELVAGFWILDVASKAEAIKWALRCPSPHGLDQDGVLELRRVYDGADLHEILPDGITQEQFDRLNASTKV
jgi:hypothetical protein